MLELSQIIETFIQHYEIVLLFFVIAVLYSSVGFGGGSSYLAILALTTLTFTQIRATALLCNIVVVTSGTIIYAKNGFYNWKKVIPLVALSIPMSFLGGYLKISQTFFYILLGITLITAAVFMWMSKYINKISTEYNWKKSIVKDGFFGGVIGLISGMVGIGGGVFLAPLLHLTNWDTPKRIAATASFFILVNSVAGLIGQFQSSNLDGDLIIDWNLIIPLMLTVFVGGQIGSRLSAKKVSPQFIKKSTAVLITIVGLRILWKYLM